MVANQVHDQPSPLNKVKSFQVELQTKNDELDYTKRGKWLRTAILGANDLLLSTASFMIEVGARDGSNDNMEWRNEMLRKRNCQTLGMQLEHQHFHLQLSLLGAVFIKDYAVRVGVLGFGGLDAFLGKTPIEILHKFFDRRLDCYGSYLWLDQTW
ncbi:vacuolar iron transporter like protein 2 [Quercus suber]|uniref:Vacuolar iron transporter like protein 2 n=1 Tax=Quercus suber TaxID=58331 RepID=A0AAW0LLI1_QUESU